MRVKKQLLVFLPLPRNLKYAYSRITLSGWTTTFFLLALLHCLSQIAIQVVAYFLHGALTDDFSTISNNSTLVPRPIPLLQGNGNLMLCDGIPRALGGVSDCITLNFSSRSRRDLTFSSPLFNATGGLEEILVRGLDSSGRNMPVVIGSQCVQTLPWVYQFLRAVTREAVAHIAFHAWLFGISFAAIVSESVPHLIASIASGVLATSWSAIQLGRSRTFQREYIRVSVKGSCNNVDLLGNYFSKRMIIEIVNCASNAVFLIALCVISWRLMKVYGQSTLNKVNRQAKMRRLYLNILSLTILIQIGTFFIGIATVLFLERFLFGVVSQFAADKTFYKITMFTMLGLIIPWLIFGWISVRKESTPAMTVFLLLDLAFIAIWSVAFFSPAFRFMFITCTFFATMTVFAMVLLVANLIAGVLCWLNFGLGLTEYLKQQDSTDPADLLRWSLAENGNDQIDREKIVITHISPASFTQPKREPSSRSSRSSSPPPRPTLPTVPTISRSSSKKLVRSRRSVSFSAVLNQNKSYENLEHPSRAVPRIIIPTSMNSHRRTSTTDHSLRSQYRRSLIPSPGPAPSSPLPATPTEVTPALRLLAHSREPPLLKITAKQKDSNDDIDSRSRSQMKEQLYGYGLAHTADDENGVAKLEGMKRDPLPMPDIRPSNRLQKVAKV